MAVSAGRSVDVAGRTTGPPRSVTSRNYGSLARVATPPAVDAVVVGAGPNGLTAAVTLAQAGLGVRVYEAAQSIGGGARTGELTLPGFRHDLCSAVHPLGAGSPALRAMPLDQHGLSWIHPPIALAHPFDDLPAATLVQSLDETAASLGIDATRYRLLVKPFLGHWDALARDSLRPIAATLPHHPVLLARYGMRGLLPASVLARAMRGDVAPAFLAGLAAHAIAPLTSPATGGVAMLFAIAGHEVGWPVPRGGSQGITDALASYLRSLGGEIVSGKPVGSLRELPVASAYMLDLVPWHVAGLANGRLPAGYVRRLEKWPHGPGVFKLDYALDGPIPWRDDRCRHAGTVHIGGSYTEIASALSSATSRRSPASSTTPEPPRASTRCGLTLTFPTDGRATSPTPSSDRSNGSRRASVTSCSHAPRLVPPSSSPAIGTTSAATSPAANSAAIEHSSARCSLRFRTPLPTRRSTCARRPRLRDRECTGCAGITRRVWRCGECSARNHGQVRGTGLLAESLRL